MNDKALEIRFNGEPFLAHRQNTLLFTHFGELAMYDHVYMLPIQGENSVLGGYVWSDHQTYDSLVDFITTYKFPQRLNCNDVASEDKKAFKRAHPNGLVLPQTGIQLPKGTYEDLQDLYFTDSFPEEWEKD